MEMIQQPERLDPPAQDALIPSFLTLYARGATRPYNVRQSRLTPAANTEMVAMVRPNPRVTQLLVTGVIVDGQPQWMTYFHNMGQGIRAQPISGYVAPVPRPAVRAISDFARVLLVKKHDKVFTLDPANQWVFCMGGASHGHTLTFLSNYQAEIFAIRIDDSLVAIGTEEQQKNWPPSLPRDVALTLRGMRVPAAFLRELYDWRASRPAPPPGDGQSYDYRPTSLPILPVGFVRRADGLALEGSLADKALRDMLMSMGARDSSALSTDAVRITRVPEDDFYTTYRLVVLPEMSSTGITFAESPTHSYVICTHGARLHGASIHSNFSLQYPPLSEGCAKAFVLTGSAGELQTSSGSGVFRPVALAHHLRKRDSPVPKTGKA